jgi:hypothetical protein
MDTHTGTIYLQYITFRRYLHTIQDVPNSTAKFQEEINHLERRKKVFDNMSPEMCGYRVVIQSCPSMYLLSACRHVLIARLNCEILTYLRSWAILEEPWIGQPLKNFPAFHGNRRFIWYSQDPSTGPYSELYQSNPHQTIPSYLSKIRFNIVHPPTSCLPSGLFPSCFPTNIL